MIRSDLNMEFIIYSWRLFVGRFNNDVVNACLCWSII